MARRDKDAKTYPKDSLNAAMAEKYLHSKGASLFEEGNIDEAADFFKKAIEIKDQPYTRYDLSLAYLKKNKVYEAIIELNRAIELNPDVPEYYLKRSHVLRMSGKILDALIDEEKAIDLDKNYALIDKIKAGLHVVKNALSGPEWLDDLAEKKIKNQRLRGVVDNLLKDRDIRREMLENASCSLPCPSHCCYFSNETILHGVHVGPWKLHAIREFLKEKGLTESEYLGRMPFEGQKYLKELIPPQFIVSEMGEKWIYYPLRKDIALSIAALRDIPKGTDYQTLLWISEKARACIFLQKGRCMIHDIGDETGLPSCKEFLCLTGFVFVVLNNLGFVDDSKIAHRKIEELNKVAVESLLILACELFGYKSVIEHGSMIEGLLKKAIEADRSGNQGATRRLTEEYGMVKDRYEGLVSARRENLRAAIDSLFQGCKV